MQDIDNVGYKSQCVGLELNAVPSENRGVQLSRSRHSVTAGCRPDSSFCSMQTLPDLRSSFVPEAPAQVEFCAGWN
jgi:hypothetical protein